MRNSLTLEISVESADAALAAQRGGADRIELCSDLVYGGLTPAAALMREVRERVTLPIFSMVRPRAGNFVYSDAEFAAMEDDIDRARKSGMDGVVLGLLRVDGRIDVKRTRELVERAQPLPVTFHRAFDVAVDLRRSLEDVIATGAKLILTSGGAETAVQGIDVLADLIRTAKGRVTIVPGSGIHAGNILQVAHQTGAVEFHAGLSGVMRTPDGRRNGFELEIRKLTETLATAS